MAPTWRPPSGLLRHQARGLAASATSCTPALVATTVRTKAACFLLLASPARSPHEDNGATRSSQASPHTKQSSPRSLPHPPAGIQSEGVRRRGRPSGAAPYPLPSQLPVTRPPSPGARTVSARSMRHRRPPPPRRVTASAATGGHPPARPAPRASTASAPVGYRHPRRRRSPRARHRRPPLAPLSTVVPLPPTICALLPRRAVPLHPSPAHRQ